MDVPLTSPAATAPDARRLPFLRYGIILGLFSAIGPLGIDLYLPAFPAIQREIGASASDVQLSLVTYFAALSGGQLAYGPLADHFGRRRPLAAGFLIFFVGAVGAALSSSVQALIGWRFVQGIGAGAGSVIAPSVVRDLGTGPSAARLFGLMIAVISVSPVLAPSLGAALLSIGSWRYNFWFMAGFALVAIALVGIVFGETLAPANRARDLKSAFVAYPKLLRDWSYLRPVLTGGLAQAGFFVYLAGSPGLLITHYGVTPSLYGILFGVNAVAMLGGSQLASPLLRRFDADRLIGFVTTIDLVLAAVLIATFLVGIDSVASTVALFCAFTACLGVMMPATTLLAVQNHPDAAGAASALLGAALFGIGCLAATALSLLSKGLVYPLFGTIALCMAAAWLIQRSGGGPPVAAETLTSNGTKLP